MKSDHSQTCFGFSSPSCEFQCCLVAWTYVALCVWKLPAPSTASLVNEFVNAEKVQGWGLSPLPVQVLEKV